MLYYSCRRKTVKVINDKILKAVKTARVVFHPLSKARKTELCSYFSGAFKLSSLSCNYGYNYPQTKLNFEFGSIKLLSGLRQKLSPNKTETGFMRGKYVTIEGQQGNLMSNVKKGHGCGCCLFHGVYFDVNAMLFLHHNLFWSLFLSKSR